MRDQKTGKPLKLDRSLCSFLEKCWPKIQEKPPTYHVIKARIKGHTLVLDLKGAIEDPDSDIAAVWLRPCCEINDTKPARICYVDGDYYLCVLVFSPLKLKYGPDVSFIMLLHKIVETK